MKVIWMRHGICHDGLNNPGTHPRPESALTMEGRDQASEAANQLRDHGDIPDLVVSSPLLRARQTAALVVDLLGAPDPQTQALFAEWRAPYCVRGLAPVDYSPDYRSWRIRRATEHECTLPGGESLRTFTDRAARARKLASTLATDRALVLIVSHRVLIGAVAALERGHRRPDLVFAAAREFQLAPTQIWRAPSTHAQQRRVREC